MAWKEVKRVHADKGVIWYFSHRATKYLVGFTAWLCSESKLMDHSDTAGCGILPTPDTGNLSKILKQLE